MSQCRVVHGVPAIQEVGFQKIEVLEHVTCGGNLKPLKASFTDTASKPMSSKTMDMTYCTKCGDLKVVIDDKAKKD